MDSLLNASSPSPENQQTPNPHPKLLELASDSVGRRIPRTGHSPTPELEQLSCPRCDSPNTKFCYYNNYNLSQPRHFCRSCRRYWTRGGALRNVPFGGGTRKAASSSSNKRPRTVAAASNRDSLVSSGSDNGVSGWAQTLDLDPDLDSGSKEAKPRSLSCFWSNGQMGLGVRPFPFNGFGIGLGPGLDYEQSVLDWPVEQESGGDGGALVVPGTWQMGGGADGGGLMEGDYFSWPDLAISTPAEALSLK